MRIEQLVELVTKAAHGEDNFKEGAVGSNGYGFIFKDLQSDIKYVTNKASHKYCGAGSCRHVLENFYKHGSLNYDVFYNLKLVGSLKTLIPNIQFGGLEKFFDAWMFVKTPEDHMFPATFYWGKLGLSIGGWRGKGEHPFKKERVLPEDITNVINFSPFDFTDDERGCLLDVLEFALKKVPISDYWGVFSYEAVHFLMGIKNGRQIIEPWEWDYFERDREAEEKLNPLLNKKFKDINNKSFSIRVLPNSGKTFRIYVMEFEYDHEGVDKVFGNAKKMLKFFNIHVKS